MTAEDVSDSSDTANYDNVIWGTGGTTVDSEDGRIYRADIPGGVLDYAVAAWAVKVNAIYQTGWFSPKSGLNQFYVKGMYGWAKRTGNYTLTIATRSRYGTSDLTTDAVNLLSGTYPDNYFQDANDNRFRIALGSGGQDLTGHSHSIVISDNTFSTEFEVHGLVIVGDHSPAGGGFPV